MSDVSALLSDVMELVGEGAEQGECTCSVFEHVTRQPNFRESTDHLIQILHGIVDYSTPAALENNVAHFLTAVIALGYALGASDAYDVTLTSDVQVPDTLEALETLESPALGERPDDN